MFKNLFKTPSASQIAVADLESAKRELLSAQTRAEHSAKMVEFYQGMVARLSTYVQGEPGKSN